MLWVRERIAAYHGDLLRAAGMASRRESERIEKAMTGRCYLSQPRAPSLPQNPLLTDAEKGRGRGDTNPRKFVMPAGSDAGEIRNMRQEIILNARHF